MELENEHRMTRMETNLDNIKEDVGELKTMLSDHIKWEEQKYGGMEKKFAPKWVERFVIALILGGAVTLISLIKIGL